MKKINKEEIEGLKEGDYIKCDDCFTYAEVVNNDILDTGIRVKILNCKKKGNSCNNNPIGYCVNTTYFMAKSHIIRKSSKEEVMVERI